MTIYSSQEYANNEVENSVAYKLLKRNKQLSDALPTELGSFCVRFVDGEANQRAVRQIAASTELLRHSGADDKRLLALCYHTLGRPVDHDSKNVAVLILDLTAPNESDKKSKQKWVYKLLRAGCTLERFFPKIFDFRLSIEKLDILFSFPEQSLATMIERGAISVDDFQDSSSWHEGELGLNKASLLQLRKARDLLLGLNKRPRPTLEQKLYDEVKRLVTLSKEIDQSGDFQVLKAPMIGLAKRITEVLNSGY
jgi:hypothetical protein